MPSNDRTLAGGGAGYTVDPTPRNPQRAGWTDVFAATVHGDRLTVRRTDSAKGWGQPLQLLATPPGEHTACSCFSTYGESLLQL